MSSLAPIWNGEEWVCKVTLPMLPFSHESEAIEISFNPEGDADNPPTAIQLATLNYIAENQNELLTLLEKAIRGYYREVRPEYLEFLDDAETEMPDNPNADEFAELHQLQGIFIHKVALEDLAYVGFSFWAAWEIEHGLGVLMHGHRIVEVGYADTSFLQWIAKGDARRKTN